MDPNQLFSADFLGEIFGLGSGLSYDQLNMNQGNTPPFFDPNIVQVASPMNFPPSYGLQPQQQATSFVIEQPHQILQPTQSTFQESQIPPTQPQQISNHQTQSGSSHLDVEISSRTNQPKRKQVARACSNCRKVHTACDNHRPCKRCILYGLECVDPPRKKRESKKLKSEKVEPISLSHITEDMDNNNNNNNNSNNNFNSNSLDFSSPQNFDFQNSNSLALIQPSVQSYQVFQQQISDPVNKMTEAISLLTQQMAELRHSNKALESKLNNVTSELEDVRASNVSKTLQLFPTSKWFSFQEQSDLSISVWRPQLVDNKRKLVLTECNMRFKQLVGYSDEVLSANFTANQLIDWQMEVCPRFKETFGKHETEDCLDPEQHTFKPVSLRTQIKSISGFKDVMITIQPIKPSKHELKYFLMHMLEVKKE